MTFTISSVAGDTQYISIQAEDTRYVSFDGHVTFTLSYPGSDICLYRISTPFPYGTGSRGYAYFNIDTIPDTATIDSIQLYYHGWLLNIPHHTPPRQDCRVTIFDISPLTDESDYYMAILYASTCANVDGFPVEGINQVIDFNNNGLTGLEALLDKTYVGIGFLMDDEGLVSKTYIKGLSSWSTPKPTLYIGYHVSVADTLTLLDPISIDIGISSNTFKRSSSISCLRFVNFAPLL
jgi:hypothetical protein